MDFKYLKLSLLIVFISTLFSCASKPPVMEVSKLSYSYSKLKLYDYDEMSTLIDDRMARYKKTGDENLLLEALQICFSRPDEDSLIEKLVDKIRFGVESVDVWEEAVEKLVETSILNLKRESISASDQVSYIIVLQNLVSEMKPQFERQYLSPKFETLLIEKIADAKIVVSEPAIQEAQVSLMKSLNSPSRLAQGLIDLRSKKIKK